MMWPPMLDMTRDECRGVLRRLELETYSNVVSTFRAQGGLSDTKIKLLEDLRNVFHISTDRHRAEARRAANDEQLCTIAEAISGPNTTQEWSREGRRSFPLLPRAAAYTALAAVANGVAEIAKNENTKLPYPSETTRVSKPVDMEPVQDVKMIVKQDPTVVMAEEKRMLKRQAQQVPEPSAVSPSSPTCKRRTFSGGSPSSENAQPSPQHPLHTNTKIQQLYHNHSKTQSRHKKGGVQKRGSAKGTPKGYVTPNPSPAKTPVTPKTPKLADSFTTPVKNNLPMPRNLHSYAASSVPQQNVQYENFPGNEKSGKLILEPTDTSSNGPQIATSKKDITNNLSKLSMMTNSPLHGTSTNSIIAESARMETLLSPIIFSTEGRSITNNAAINPTPTTWVQKPQPTATSTTIAQRPAKILTANTSAFRPNSNKTLPQSPHQASPNSSAISLSSGYININQKSIKPENATIVNLKDGKEIELANTGMVASTAFVRQDSIVNIDSASCKPPTIIGTGNFDLKTNTEVNPAMFSASSTSGTRPKIQIHSNQTISPGFGNIKLATAMQLKGVAGRKAVQIVSSSGKVFIQPADGSKSQTGSMSTSGTLATNANRYAFQKVQILPSSSTTSIKPININKSDVILMPSGVLSTASNSGNVVVRGIPMMKQNKRLSTQIINKPLLSELNSSGAGLAKNQNVIVIGAVATEKGVKVGNNKTMNEGNMITEDTPVDILTTPISNLENPIDITTPAMSKDIAAKYEIKSPITVVQTIASPKNEEPTTTRRLLVKEETVSRLPVNRKMQQQQPSKPETLKTSRHNSESVDNENSYIVSSTDWEVELDHQQAAASKNRNNQTIIIQEPPQQIQSADVSSAALTADEDECKDDTSQQIIDNFNDVIEEDTTYEEESIINETTEGDDDVDYDISYASTQDDIEDHVAIEYVEDAGTSSDAMIEEYSEVVRSDTDDNDKSHSKMLPVSHAQTIMYSTNTAEHRGKVVHSSESSSVIYEIDENGFNQINR